MANLSGQSISTTGTIDAGVANHPAFYAGTPIAVGTTLPNVTDKYEEVSETTPRIPKIKVTVGTGFSNSGALLECPVNLNQPPILPSCFAVGASTEFYLSQGFTNPFDVATVCQNNYVCSTPVKRDSSLTIEAMGVNNGLVCQGSTPFQGKSLWYIAANLSGTTGGRRGAATEILRINNNGMCIGAKFFSCGSLTTGDR